MPRAKPPCGNPLYLQWMEELRDAAREKGMKSAEGYSKACKSLQNCPVTYSRPRDLVVLQHIGEKTVAILEKKWKVHCEENGIVVESPTKKAKGKARAVASDLDPDDASLLSDSADQAPKPKKARKPSKPKPYIPARGSGPYGILLALVLAIDQPEINTQVFLTKNEIIRVAQEFCDASYEHSEKGNYFTAWSGMKTLVNRGYVYVTGNPQKHCLTEEGYEVAVAIRNLRPEFASTEKLPFLHTPAVGSSTGALIPSQRVPVAPTKSSGVASASSSRKASPQKSVNGNKPEKFQFWYIDSSGARTTSLTAAMIRLDPVEFINLRKIEFRYSQRHHSIVSHLRLVDDHGTAKERDDSGSRTLYGFIVEETAPPLCSKFDDISAGKENLPVTTTLEPAESVDTPLTLWDDDGQPDYRPEFVDDTNETLKEAFPLDAVLARSDPHKFSRTHSAPSTGIGQMSPKPTSSLAAEAALRRAGHASSAFGRSHSAVVDLSSASKAARPAPRLSSHMPSPILPPTDDHPSPALSSVTASSVPTFTPSDAIEFPPGSYEIVLIVDTREVESRSNRDKIAESLAAKGVKVETRALRLGDMCWIARRTEGGLGGEEDECVLDYVAERKRLDDLCSSIRDGRYNEQCFRLSNSGINHVYYIVEDWHVAEKMEYHGLQIMTAKSQIQVHNRFFLKETHKLSETIDFLATMTNVIKSSHQGKSVHVIPTRFLSRSTYGPLQAHLKDAYPLNKFHTSFVAYQDLNDKSASQTLREKFARMLLCVKGMSAERVSAVLDEWETPIALWESLKEHNKTTESLESTDGADKGGKKRKRGKEMMFADKIKGEGRRKIGDALSKELWRAFMGETQTSS
ncbi:hypothetical protein CI109_100517 [Kwoniella shandongensis]|uniref:Crossover junction endonuclease MUS81 n=1 Tax=Kwoniella shandongensis TaxID=1734106 RepID=A0A5M6BQP2_9TREE|nr:uncharacterized protein CI109_007357 [Kwoniella shandongensis]KAA5524310.1 hypothetical protein CI109_007357 [Kwoniella shandongensis]